MEHHQQSSALQNKEKIKEQKDKNLITTCLPKPAPQQTMHIVNWLNFQVQNQVCRLIYKEGLHCGYSATTCLLGANARQRGLAGSCPFSNGARAACPQGLHADSLRVRSLVNFSSSSGTFRIKLPQLFNNCVQGEGRELFVKLLHSPLIKITSIHIDEEKVQLFYLSHQGKWVWV